MEILPELKEKKKKEATISMSRRAIVGQRRRRRVYPTYYRDLREDRGKGRELSITAKASKEKGKGTARFISRRIAQEKKKGLCEFFSMRKSSKGPCVLLPLFSAGGGKIQLAITAFFLSSRNLTSKC